MVGPTSMLAAATGTLIMALCLAFHWRRVEREQETTRPAEERVASPPWWVMPDLVRDHYRRKPGHNA